MLGFPGGIWGWLVTGKALWHTGFMLVSSLPHAPLTLTGRAARAGGFQQWDPPHPRRVMGVLPVAADAEIVLLPQCLALCSLFLLQMVTA